MNLDKLMKKLPPGFADDVASLGEPGLKDVVLQAETNIRRVEQEREADERLSGAKEIVKDLNGPYRDAINAQRAKIAYVLYVLEERGKLPEAT